MKKGLYLFIVYLCSLIGGLVFGTLFVGVYMSSLNFLAGRQIVFFDKANFYPAFCTVSMAICFLLPLSLYAYKIRHQGKAVQACVFIVLQCLTWFGIFPFFNYRINRYMEVMSERLVDEGHVDMELSNTLLSSGFFREHNGYVYYFLDDLTVDYEREQTYRGIVIETGNLGRMYHYSETNPEKSELITSAYPYKDNLIKSTYQNSVLNNISYIGDLMKAGRTALARGFWNYIVFLSVALALSVVYMLAHISRWRAVNFVSVCFATGCILFYNIFYYSPYFVTIRSTILKDVGLFRAMSSWCDEPFIFLSNIAFTLIIVTIGIVEKVSLKKEGSR